MQLLPRRELGKTCRMTPGCKGVLCVEAVPEHPVIDAARQRALARLGEALASPTGRSLTVDEFAALLGGVVHHAEDGHGDRDRDDHLRGDAA